MVTRWNRDSNNVVIAAVPDEYALAALAARAGEEGIARTLVREPDLDNTLTAVAMEPVDISRRLCANLPLAGKVKVKGDLAMV